MDIELRDLMDRISELRDDELWTIVHGDSAHYRREALTYAKAEINRRGISSDQVETIRTSTPLESIARLRTRLVRAIRNRAFLIGFLSSSLLFAWANYHSYVHMYPVGLYDVLVYYGFPFDLYQTGGFGGPTMVLWPGFIADTAIAALTGVCVGWVFKLLLQRGSAMKLVP